MVSISAVVPIYKTKEHLLRDCIVSLMRQTLKDIEIILVDDGSPDICGSICDEYAAQDGRIQVIHKKNEGVSVARNVGIECSKGEYVTFVDADDWIEQQAFETAYKIARENKVDVLQWTYIWHRGRKTENYNPVFLESGLLNNNQLEEIRLKAIIDTHPSFSCNCGFAAGSPWAKLYNKEFLIQNNLRFVPGLTRSQDRIFNLFTYNVAKKIYYLNEPFYHYIANDASAVVSYRPNVEAIYDMYLKKIDEFILRYKNGNGLYNEARAICQCYVLQQIFNQYLFNKKINDMLRGFPEWFQ